MTFESGTLDPSPLLRHLELTVPARPGNFPDGGYNAGLACTPLPVDDDVAEACGVTRRTIQRWRHGTLLRENDADRIATRLGLHPALIWDSWYSEP